jgi:hypothetical protein
LISNIFLKYKTILLGPQALHTIDDSHPSPFSSVQIQPVFQVIKSPIVKKKKKTHYIQRKVKRGKVPVANKYQENINGFNLRTGR